MRNACDNNSLSESNEIDRAMERTFCTVQFSLRSIAGNSEKTANFNQNTGDILMRYMISRVQVFIVQR